MATRIIPGAGASVDVEEEAIGSRMTAGCRQSDPGAGADRGYVKGALCTGVALLVTLVIWGALALLSRYLHEVGMWHDAPSFYPISVFVGPRINLQGIPYAAGFVIVLVIALRYAEKLGPVSVGLVGFTLLVLGNLIQGGLTAGFLDPINGEYLGCRVQYYHDAVAIQDWRAWLSDFNASQHSLLVHSRTHPPFAVLLHYALMMPAAIATVFVSVTSLAAPLLWGIFRMLDVPRSRSTVLAILLFALPAQNIYGAVSLDAVTATFSLLFLYGLVRVVVRGPDSRAIMAFSLGLLVANALTFGAVVLVAIAVGVAFWENRRCGNRGVGIVLVITLCIAAAANIVLVRVFGYEHVLAFLRASALENPGGFSGVARPVEYLMTRLENCAELALFFSLPCLVFVICSRQLKERPSSSTDDFPVRVAVVGILMLAAVFVAGAYRTGETARTCLFIYPYLLLPFWKVSKRTLSILIVMAGIQTIAMQMGGNFFW